MDDKKEFVGGYVDAKLKEDLEAIATKEDRSMNWLLEKLLTEGVKHRKRTRRKESVV
jgi:hypothetical protein